MGIESNWEIRLINRPYEGGENDSWGKSHANPAWI